MEQKTNPSGEQAATQAPQPTAWIERVRALADELGNELDNRKSGEEDRRGFILVAVDGTNANDGKLVVTMGATAGHSIALGMAVKHVLTGEPFAKHMQTAAKMMAIDTLAGDGKGTVVIDLRDNEGDDGQADDQEQTQEEADGE